MRLTRKALLGAAALSSLLFLSCASTSSSVTRVDANTQTDLSGFWNDTDVRIVCDTLIASCLNSGRVSQEIARKGRLPVFLVGTFRNESDEHIDGSIITTTMETAIFNSGRADFVAGGAVRGDLRAERQDQQMNSSESSAASLGNETGADFLLTGTVRTIIDQAGGTSTRTYFVSAELTNIETNQRLWIDQNSEIKKVIQRSRTRL